MKTQALECKGLSAEDVISEQNRVWNEKLAELLRQNSMDSMKQYFPQHIAEDDVKEPITFHCITGWAILIRWKDFEFEDRVDLVEEGLAIIQEEFLDPAKRKVGIPFGAAVARFDLTNKHTQTQCEVQFREDDCGRC